MLGAHDTRYLGAYEPIIDINKEVIGAVFVGIPQQESLAPLHELKLAGLTRISHQGRCIGPGVLTKLFCENDLSDATAGSDADTVYL